MQFHLSIKYKCLKCYNISLFTSHYLYEFLIQFNSVLPSFLFVWHHYILYMIFNYRVLFSFHFSETTNLHQITLLKMKNFINITLICLKLVIYFIDVVKQSLIHILKRIIKRNLRLVFLTGTSIQYDMFYTRDVKLCRRYYLLLI